MKVAFFWPMLTQNHHSILILPPKFSLSIPDWKNKHGSIIGGLSSSHKVRK